MKPQDRLTYERILEYKEKGQELCGYIRNPTKDLTGRCGLNGLKCKAIFTEHRNCTNCLDYFLTHYGTTI